MPSHIQYSIIVAAYNVAEEINQCMDSLVHALRPGCEIIVVNDGSTDDTRHRLLKYEDDPRIHTIDQENSGLSEARNAAMDVARGEYWLFVDGDDWVEPEFIDTIDDAVRHSPTGDFFVFGFYEYDHGERLPATRTADFWRMSNSAWNKVYHRHLFDGLRFDRRLWYEDLALVPVLFLRARQPITIDAKLYNYRRDRTSSITNSIDGEKLYQLVEAANRCLARIEADVEAGRIAPPEETLGPNWRARFETSQIFIPGVLHRSRQMPNRRLRRQYIAGMLARLPSRKNVDLNLIRTQYGLKMALGSALYRHGQVTLGHFVLHDTGAIRQQLSHWTNRESASPTQG